MSSELQIRKLLEDVSVGKKDPQQAEAELFHILKKKSLLIADIRNKLGSIKNLIALLETKSAPEELIKQEIEQSKIAIRYLSAENPNADT